MARSEHWLVSVRAGADSAWLGSPQGAGPQQEPTPAKTGGSGLRVCVPRPHTCQLVCELRLGSRTDPAGGLEVES